MGIDFKSKSIDTPEFLDLGKLAKVFDRYLPRLKTTWRFGPSSASGPHLILRAQGLPGALNLELTVHPNGNILLKGCPDLLERLAGGEVVREGKRLLNYGESKEFLLHFTAKLKVLIEEAEETAKGSVKISSHVWIGWDFWRVVRTYPDGKRTIVHSDGRVFHFAQPQSGANPLYSGTFNPSAQAQQLPRRLSDATLWDFVKVLTSWVDQGEGGGAIYPPPPQYQLGSIVIVIGRPGRSVAASLTNGHFYDELEVEMLKAENAAR